MLQVRAIECVGIQEDRHGVVERDAVFRRVGLGLPRVPLEHLFSIYGITGMLGATDKEAGAHATRSIPEAQEDTETRTRPARPGARKSAVLSSLTSRSGQRTYDHAIREFVAWYCSEPRLAFNRTVVLRYRIHLEQRQYAPTTINIRLAAVRRVAYEAADYG